MGWEARVFEGPKVTQEAGMAMDLSTRMRNIMVCRITMRRTSSGCLKLFQKGGHTLVWTVVAFDKAGSPSLNLFQVFNIQFGVGVPCSSSVFDMGAYQSLVRYCLGPLAAF